MEIENWYDRRFLDEPARQYYSQCGYLSRMPYHMTKHNILSVLIKDMPCKYKEIYDDLF